MKKNLYSDRHKTQKISQIQKQGREVKCVSPHLVPAVDRQLERIRQGRLPEYHNCKYWIDQLRRR